MMQFCKSTNGLTQSEPINTKSQYLAVLFFYFGGDTISADEFLKMTTMREGPVGVPFRIPELGTIARRLPKVAGVNADMFHEKVQALASLEHGSLSPVLECYSSLFHRLIISKDIPGLTLHALLHDDERGSLTNWAQRLSVVKGITKAMFYLHNHFTGEEAPHGDLNSSSVVMATNSDGRLRKPILVNYKLIRFLPRDHDILQLALSRTPEITEQLLLGGQLMTNRYMDVYCLGVLYLELLTGMNPKVVDMRLVRSAIEKKVIDNSGEWKQMLHCSLIKYLEEHGNMLKLLIIALECTESTPDRRHVMASLYPLIEDLG